MTNEQHVGKVITTESKVHRVTYETASWYTDVEVPPGEYEVVLTSGYPWILVRYHGIIVDEHFVNRVFQYTSVVEKKHIGEKRTCSAQLHPYIAAEQFLRKDGWILDIDAGWEAHASVEKSSIHKEGQYTSHWLVTPEGRVIR